MANDRKTLGVKITLDGAEKIKADLGAIGVAGQKAFQQIKAAVDRVAPGLSTKIEAGLARIRAGFASIDVARARAGLAFGRFRGDLAGVAEALSRTVLRFVAFKAAVVGAVTSLALLARSAVETVDSADEAAQSLGLTISAYTALTGAASTAGVSQEQFGTSLTRLNGILADSAKDTSEAAQSLFQFGDATVRVRRGVESGAGAVDKNASALTRLGIRARGTNGQLRSTDDVLLDIADAFAKMPDGAEKSALAVELFGKAGVRLIPFLNEGRSGIKEFTEDAKRMGVVLTEQDKKIAQLADKGMARLGLALDGLRIRLGLLFAPAQAEGSNRLADFIIENRKVIEDFARDTLEKAIVLVQDFVNAFRGLDDKVENKWVLDLRDGFNDMKDAADKAINQIIIPAFEKLRATAESVAQKINSVFGTNLSGDSLLMAGAILHLAGAFQLLGVGAVLAASALRLLWAGLLILSPAVTGLFAAIAAAVGLPVIAVVGIAAAIGIAAALIYIYWDEIEAAANAAYGRMVLAADQAGAEIAEAFNDFVRIKDAFNEGGITGALAEMGEQAKREIGQINEELKLIGIDLPAVWQTIADGAASAAAGIRDQFSDPDSFTRQFFSAWLSSWQSTFNSIGSFARGMANTLRSIIGSAINYLIGLMNRLIAKAREALATSRAARGGGGGGSGFADGGHVTGPGTGTSDSIPAWLSNGEFVMTARAVRKYGLGFMAAINRLRLPRGMLSGLKLGGLVRASGFDPVALGNAMTFNLSPRFALGGPVEAAGRGTSQQRPFQLVLPNGETVNGMTASEDAVTQISRFAARAGLASAGRKPAWFGV